MAEVRLASVLYHLRQLGGGTADGLSDGHLLRRFAAGREESAFAALLERHGRLVWGVCRRVLRQEQDAEDAFQATFLVLAKKADSIRKQESLASWLYGVAYRVALKARARAAARQARALPAEREAFPGPPAEAALRELQALLDEEVAQLPAKLRAPFVLCCLEGRSKGEAARELGWKHGTVSGRLAEARERLRTRLARRGVALSAGLTAAALAHESASAALRRATASAVMGRGAAPSAVTLARGALRAAAVSKLKALTGLMILILACAAGAGLVARGSDGAPPAPPPAGEEAGAGLAALREAAPGPAPAEEPAPAARLDLLGDPLPPGALARFGTARLRHGGLVEAVAFAPDGKGVAAAGTDGAIRFWDPATGRALRTWPGHPGGALGLAFSPDGKALASGGRDKLIRVWNVAVTAQTEETPPVQAAGHEGIVMSLAFSRDGKTLFSGSFDGTIRAWDPASGTELRRFEPGPGKVRSIALSPDGKLLASANLTGNFPFKGTVHLWDPATGKHLRQLGPELKETYKVAFSPDGDTLAVAADGRMRLFEVAGGDELHPSKVNGQGAFSVAFSPDGRTVAYGSSGRLRLVHAGTGRELRQFEGEQNYFYSIAFSPDGKTVAAGGTRTVGLWDAATGKERLHFAGHAGAVSALFFSPDGKRLLTGGYGPALRRWDVSTGKETGAIKGAPQWNNNAVLSPDGKAVVVQGDNLVFRLLDARTGQELRVIEGHKPRKMWAGSAMSFAFTADGKTLASAVMGHVDNKVRLWDVASGQELKQFAGPADGPVALALAPDGKALASATWPGELSLWDVASGQERRFSLGARARPYLAFAPGGRLLAVGAGEAIALWDVAEGRPLRGWTEPRGEVAGLAFSRDGRMLAVAGAKDGPVRLWEVATGKVRLTIGGHVGAVKGVAFSPDGRLLATGGDDTTALLWDLRALALLGQADLSELSAKRLDELWTDLAGTDAAAAYRAVQLLARAPRQTVPLVKERIGPVQPKRVDKLIAQLDDDDFATREKATEELIALGRQAEDAVRKAAAAGTAEVRLRAAKILGRLGKGGDDDKPRLQALRALEVLEAIGTPEARRVIEDLTKGAPQAELTQEARAAPARLGRRDG